MLGDSWKENFGWLFGAEKNLFWRSLDSGAWKYLFEEKCLTFAKGKHSFSRTNLAGIDGEKNISREIPLSYEQIQLHHVYLNRHNSCIGTKVSQPKLSCTGAKWVYCWWGKKVWPFVGFDVRKTKSFHFRLSDIHSKFPKGSPSKIIMRMPIFQCSPWFPSFPPTYVCHFTLFTLLLLFQNKSLEAQSPPWQKSAFNFLLLLLLFSQHIFPPLFFCRLRGVVSSPGRRLSSECWKVSRELSSPFLLSLLLLLLLLRMAPPLPATCVSTHYEKVISVSFLAKKRMCV